MLRKKASVENINVEDMEHSIEKSYNKVLHRSMSMVSSQELSPDNSASGRHLPADSSPTPKGVFSDILQRTPSLLMHAIDKAVISHVRNSVPDEFKHLFNKEKMKSKGKKRRLQRAQTDFLSVSFEHPKVQLELIDSDQAGGDSQKSTKNSRSALLRANSSRFLSVVPKTANTIMEKSEEYESSSCKPSQSEQADPVALQTVSERSPAQPRFRKAHTMMMDTGKKKEQMVM